MRIKCAKNKVTLVSWILLMLYPLIYVPLLQIEQPHWFPVFRDRFTPLDFINYDTQYHPKGVPTHTPTPIPVNMKTLDRAVTSKKFLETEFTYYTMEFEYLGTYFITAYSPEECGYNGSNYPRGWTTASDTICHQSSDWTTPNTCAIDRSYHKYGEHLLVGDPDDPDNRQVVITEDCGPGVRGHWIDMFVDSYDQVINWNTRYDSVYRVHYIEHTMTGKELMESIDYGILINRNTERSYVYQRHTI